MTPNATPSYVSLILASSWLDRTTQSLRSLEQPHTNLAIVEIQQGFLSRDKKDPKELAIPLPERLQHKQSTQNKRKTLRHEKYTMQNRIRIIMTVVLPPLIWKSRKWINCIVVTSRSQNGPTPTDGSCCYTLECLDVEKTKENGIPHKAIRLPEILMPLSLFLPKICSCQSKNNNPTAINGNRRKRWHLKGSNY